MRQFNRTENSLWQFWRWWNLENPRTRTTFLRRLYIANTPFLGVKLHWLLEPDWARDLHDHPWTFISIVLRGGYYEEVKTPEGTELKKVFWWNLKRAGEAHRIAMVLPGTITLVINGPKVREWGFHTRQGWEHWKAYLGI